LITNGSTEQLRAHLGIAKTNGVTETELKEMIIHLAFYAGLPRAMSAIMVAKEVVGEVEKHGIGCRHAQMMVGYES
jgi:4-carboxymuconolactone decarboxylase